LPWYFDNLILLTLTQRKNICDYFEPHFSNREVGFCVFVKAKEKMIQKNTLEDIYNFMDSLADVQERPYNIMSKVFGNKHGLNAGKRPKETLSNEDPPIKIKEDIEIIQIDETLGQYDPKEDKITIFSKSIEQASSIFKCSPKHLMIIVGLHEMAHAIINVKYEIRNLTADMEEIEFGYLLERTLEDYNKFDKKLHEHLAQWLTFHALKLKKNEAKTQRSKETFDRLINIFDTLNRYQPHEYRIDTSQNIQKDRIVESIKLIKIGWLSGSFVPWNVVIRW